jgi:hypothetical protein
VQALIHTFAGQSYHNYYLRIEDRVIKVDWEASVGYWSMPVKMYLARGTNEDIVARVSAEIGNYYNDSFFDKQRTFQHVSLRTADGKHLDAYVPRSSPVYNDVMDILSDGNSHDVTLAIANINDETHHPVISAVLSRSWIVEENTDKDKTPITSTSG